MAKNEPEEEDKRFGYYCKYEEPVLGELCVTPQGMSLEDYKVACENKKDIFASSISQPIITDNSCIPDDNATV